MRNKNTRIYVPHETIMAERAHKARQRELDAQFQVWFAENKEVYEVLPEDQRMDTAAQDFATDVIGG